MYYLIIASFLIGAYVRSTSSGYYCIIITVIWTAVFFIGLSPNIIESYYNYPWSFVEITFDVALENMLTYPIYSLIPAFAGHFSVVLANTCYAYLQKPNFRLVRSH